MVLQGLPSPTGAAHEATGQRFACTCWSETPATLWSAATIGPPAGEAHGLVALRQRGRSGRSLRVIAAPGVVGVVEVDGVVIRIQPSDGSGPRDVHRRTDDGWRVEVEGARAMAPVELRGVRAARSTPVPPARNAAAPPDTVRTSRRNVLSTTLAAPHYRQTEVPWREAGEPTATVALSGLQDGELLVHVSARYNRAPNFAPAQDVNPLDNELSDVNSDGVQLHWRSLVDGATWNSVVAVPEGDGVRLTAAEGQLDGLTASWLADRDAVNLAFVLPCPPTTTEFTFAVCVNDCPPGRERRRGQLVLGGRAGETAYLRGARQSPDRALRVIFEPEHP